MCDVALMYAKGGVFHCSTRGRILGFSGEWRSLVVRLVWVFDFMGEGSGLELCKSSADQLRGMAKQSRGRKIAEPGLLVFAALPRKSWSSGFRATVVGGGKFVVPQKVNFNVRFCILLMYP